MKLNSNVTITGQKVILVPYKEEHVLKYHEWMQSAEVRQLSATPHLTLEQEYEMQKKLNDDENKCTFIILDKGIFDENTDEVEAMVGETIIYLIDYEPTLAEIEIMMVDSSAAGKKMAWEAISLMLIYGIQHLNIHSFEAKMALTNEFNISLFTRLTFREVSKSETFDEVTYKKMINEDWTTWLTEGTPFELHTL